jgi:hypothetical protein
MAYGGRPCQRYHALVAGQAMYVSGVGVWPRLPLTPQRPSEPIRSPADIAYAIHLPTAFHLPSLYGSFVSAYHTGQFGDSAIWPTSRQAILPS